MRSPRTSLRGALHRRVSLYGLAAAAVAVVLLLTIQAGAVPRASALEWTSDLVNGPTPHWTMLSVADCVRRTFDYDAPDAGAEQYRMWNNCNHTGLDKLTVPNLQGKLLKSNDPYLGCNYGISDDGFTPTSPYLHSRCAGHWGINRMIGLQPWHFEFSIWLDRDGNGVYLYAGTALFQELKGKLYLDTPPSAATYWRDVPWTQCGDEKGWNQIPMCNWVSTPEMLPKYTGIG